MKKRESVLVILFTLAVWGLLAYFLFFLQVKNQGGDTAFVAQVLYNFRHTLRMQTTYYTSTTESIDHVWYKSANEVCTMDLETKFRDTPWGHHYLIAYLLIPIARVMEIPLLIAVLQAGIYTSVLLFAYLLARQKKLNIPLALLFTVLVMQHPLWNQGLIGQLYFNRLFLPLCGLIILLLEKRKINYWFVLFVGLLAAGTNEIYGITLFTVFVSYLWIYKKIDKKLFTFGVLFLGFGFASTAYIQQHFPLRSTQTGSLGALFGHGLNGIMQAILSNVINPKTKVFVIVSAFAISPFAVFSYRLILPLLLFLIPNILINIGGAEKIGWSTHYHIGYFIPLIWLSLLGFSRINRWPGLQGAFISASIVVLMLVNPLNLQFNRDPNIAIKNLFRNILYYHQHGKLDLQFREKLRETVGKGETLSIPEAISYNFYDHIMYYYPMGIDSVSTVILRYDSSKTGDQRFSSINYGHQDPHLDVCILNRMRKGGFDLSNPAIIDGWAIFKRKSVL